MEINGVEAGKKNEHEETLYNNFVNAAYYPGTDITEYNEELYDNYQNNFKDIIYQIAKETTYLLDDKLQEESKNANENNIVTILLENGQYLVNGDYNKATMGKDEIYGASVEGGVGIVLPSNVVVDLNQSTIKQINDYRNNQNQNDVAEYNRYQIFRIESGKNITIKNGILVGDKAERTLTEHGENGTGILLRTADGDGKNYITIENVLIEELIIKYMCGDGIEINSPITTVNWNMTSKNIIIKNNYIYCCNRQGISVVHTNGTTIDHNVIYNIIGTDPSACIDVEPPVNSIASNKSTLNLSPVAVDNVSIKNNVFNNQKAIDILYNVGDVLLENNEIYGRLGFANTDGKIEFENNSVNNYIHWETFAPEGNNVFGSYMQIGNNGHSKVYKITDNGGKWNPQCVIIHDNSFNNYMLRIHYSTFTEIYNNAFSENFTRLNMSTATCEYDKVYIHDNVFKRLWNEIYIAQVVAASESKKELQIYSNKYGADEIIDVTFDEDENAIVNEEFREEIESGVFEDIIKVNADTKRKLQEIKDKDIGYIRITKSSNKTVYWIGEGEENYKTFNPIGMQIAVCDAIGEEKVRIDVETGEETVDIGSNTYKITTTNIIEPTTMRIEIKLINTEDQTEEYTTYQKVRTKTAYNATQNTIRNDDTLWIGDDISLKNTVRTKFYVKTANNAYDALVSVPKEEVEWTINEKTENKNIIEANDLNSNGKITIKAKYCGLTLTKTVSVRQEARSIVINPNTTIRELELEIDKVVKTIKGEEEIIDKDSIIGTGYKIKIPEANQEIEYIAIVIGDCNGDGNANINDMVKINNYRLYGTTLNFDELYQKAADVNEDGKIDIKDMVRINNYRLYGSKIR